MTDQLGIELATVKREVDVKIYPIERSLRCIHSLKVLFEILS